MNYEYDVLNGHCWEKTFLKNHGVKNNTWDH